MSVRCCLAPALTIDTDLGGEVFQDSPTGSFDVSAEQYERDFNTNSARPLSMTARSTSVGVGSPIIAEPRLRWTGLTHRRAINTSIGAWITFDLTAGDSMSFTSSFVADIPAPSGPGLAMAAGLFTSRRQRR